MPLGSLRDLKSTAELQVAANCLLRPLRDDEVTIGYVDGLNDPVVNQHLVDSRGHQQTLDSVRAYVSANDESDRDILFGIFIDDELRGTVRLHDVDATEGTARVGILLFDRRYWAKGWASRAIGTVLRFASTEMHVSRFWAGMRSNNIGSRRTFEGLGFTYQPSADWTDDDRAVHHFFFLDHQ